MVMSPINYLEFSEKDNIIFEFNYKNLVEKVTYLLPIDYSYISYLFLSRYLTKIYWDYIEDLKGKIVWKIKGKGKIKTHFSCFKQLKSY